MEDSGILVVDDDRDYLNLIKQFFVRKGVSIHCAESGGEALRKLRGRCFTLMLTDLHMPGMDGLELARRAREVAPDMPIILSTGQTTPEIIRQAKKTDIAMVFAKPLDFRELLAVARGVGHTRASYFGSSLLCNLQEASNERI